MASLLDTLIETITKDFEALENIKDPKALRKEKSLLRGRIESAQKLTKNDTDMNKKLDNLMQKLT